jgi:hypothetical protein
VKKVYYLREKIPKGPCPPYRRQIYYPKEVKIEGLAVAKPNVMHQPTFTTPELLQLVGLTRRQLQALEEVKSVVPLVPADRPGRGNAARWSVMQVIAVAYGRAFLDAGCHTCFAHAACRWVSDQEPGKLLAEFAAGRTLLCLAPSGESFLAQPCLGRDCTREQRLLAAKLDLARTYEGLLRRMFELVSPADRAGLERVHGEALRLAAELARLREQEEAALLKRRGLD